RRSADPRRHSRARQRPDPPARGGHDRGADRRRAPRRRLRPVDLRRRPGRADRGRARRRGGALMTTILARSRWTSTAAKGRAMTWSRIRGIVCHYPAMGKSVGVLTPAQETSRLRGWRNYHVGSLRWSDIGYNYCITQAGRVYSLRGDRVGAHAVGHNSTTLGVLFMVGDNEALTKEAQAAFRALRATLRKRGAGSGVWGHTQMSGNSTRCPGPYIMGDIRSGALTGKAAPVQKADPWNASATINALSKAEVKKIQQQLKDRGYSLGSYGVDGSYGKDTYNAVRAFQKAAGLAVDGVAGPDTRKALT